MNFLSYLFPRTIARLQSNFNGEISIKEFYGKRYIEVGGLMQSGRIPQNLFKGGFKKFKLSSSRIGKILIFGLGGGTVAQLLYKFFPKASLTAVEIDPVMVEVAEEFFDLRRVKNLQIIEGDALSRALDVGRGYDLVVVDLFKGYEIPKQVAETEFLQRLHSLLSRNGSVIFNRLYFQKYKIEADIFLDKVREIFQDVRIYKNYFNILIHGK